MVHEGADSEVIVGELAATGTVSPAGAPLSLSGLLILRVRDGLIVHTRDCMDALGVHAELGTLPDVVAALAADGSANAASRTAGAARGPATTGDMSGGRGKL